MNLQLVLKFLLSAAVIAGASEFAKRNVSLGALLIALPLTSLLAIIWQITVPCKWMVSIPPLKVLVPPQQMVNMVLVRR